MRKRLPPNVSDALLRLVSKAHKLPAEELANRLIDLSNQSKTIESAFECLPVGVMIVGGGKMSKSGEGGISRKMQYANKAACRILGINTARNGDFACDDEDVWECVSSSEVASFLHETLIASNIEFSCSREFSIASSSGNVHFIQVTIYRIWTSGEGEQYIGDKAYSITDSERFIITAQDVTQKRKDEVRARRLESLAELTTLAANMAHEIKNPLGAISIHVQLVQKALSIARKKGRVLMEEKFLEEPLKVVTEEVNSLNSLVMQFLMAVRPIKARQEIVDVCAIVRETIDFVSIEFEKNGFIAKAEGEVERGGEVRLLIDSRLMKEVLINMAQNSLSALLSRFSGEESGGEEGIREGGSGEGVKGYFIVDVKEAGDVCILTISDNGEGMDSEVSQRIFEPYFTTKAQGTGLGMTMVYKIVKEFGGSIEVKSVKYAFTAVKECGTTFTIRLPLPNMGDVKRIEYKGE